MHPIVTTSPGTTTPSSKTSPRSASATTPTPTDVTSPHARTNLHSSVTGPAPLVTTNASPTSPFSVDSSATTSTPPARRESSRYEWNEGEFTATQRKRSSQNMPVMTVQQQLHARVQWNPNSRQDSHESLFDEEGFSLKPVKHDG
ncbi:hypothetical protein HDU98_002877 [Podochytrium sp. JEL0797]|nr:hypothetical protein HDU98_002877 [Podochytrium sp. JEL0797]